MEANKDYIGKVVYIDDVTHTGRCKIRVFSLFDYLDDENLPWFTPGNITKFSSDGGGCIDIPKVGSIVKVRFTSNDFYSGEYYALPMLDPLLVKEIEDDYEDTHVLLFDGDQELAVIYQKMSGLKIYHKGSSIIIDPVGNIQLKHQNNSNVIEVNDDQIIITSSTGGNSTGTINISSGNTINLKAPTIHLESNDIRLGAGSTENHFVGAKQLEQALSKIANELKFKFPIGTSLDGEPWQKETLVEGITCN